MSNGPIQPMSDPEVQEAVKRTEARLAEMGIKFGKIEDKLEDIEAKLEQIDRKLPTP